MRLIEKVEKEWERWEKGVRLVTIHYRYRRLITPLSKFIDTIKYKTDDTGARITVVTPQFYTKHRWQAVLHNQSGALIRAYLVRTKDIAMTTIPYRFKK